MSKTRDAIHDVPDGLPRLLEVMRRLRDPDTGCPWDIEQNFASIAPYTIEEAYEVADAIERAAWTDLEGELGDLLLQVVYHGQMGAEAGHFDFDSVARRTTAKMIDRHPHVFGEEQVNKSAVQQTRDWESAKASERAAGGAAGVLDDVAFGLPALLRAVKLQKRAARVGFDWPSAEEEFGDLLFVIANLARHLNVDPEAALRDANAKFTRRFKSIEAALSDEGRRPEDSTLEEMDALWDRAKLREKK